MRYLVTGFKPFNARKDNTSRGTAERLGELLQQVAGVTSVQVKILEVVWDSVYRYTEELPVQNYDYIVGLGEHHSNFWIEKYAEAFAFGYDEQKNYRPAPSQQLNEALGLLPLDLKCEASIEQDPVVMQLFRNFGHSWRVLHNDGREAFVCNYLRRRLAENVLRKKVSTKIGFVHILEMGIGLEQNPSPEAVYDLCASISLRVMELDGWLPNPVDWSRLTRS